MFDPLNCPKLRQKPKLFFFLQAYHDKNVDIDVNSDYSNSATTDHIDKLYFDTMRMYGFSTVKRAQLPDQLVFCYSYPSEFYLNVPANNINSMLFLLHYLDLFSFKDRSRRRKVEENVFIDVLCSVLSEQWRKQDLHSMLNEVRRRLLKPACIVPQVQILAAVTCDTLTAKIKFYNSWSDIGNQLFKNASFRGAKID